MGAWELAKAWEAKGLFDFRNFPCPSEPVKALVIPLRDDNSQIHAVELKREIIGTRRRAGAVEIRCQYGVNSRWYKVGSKC